MNREQFEHRLDDLINSLVDDLRDKWRERCLRLYSSGGLNPPDYQDDLILPKMILALVMEEEAEARLGMLKRTGYTREINNLRHFVTY